MEHRFKKGEICYEKKELTDAGYQFALVHQFQLNVRKSNTRRWHVVCKSVQDPPCAFSATAVSKGEGSVWTITVFNEAHGCQSLLHTGDSKVPARVLGNMITDKVTDTPDSASKELRKIQKGAIIIPPHFPRRTGRPIKRGSGVRTRGPSATRSVASAKGPDTTELHAIDRSTT